MDSTTQKPSALIRRPDIWIYTFLIVVTLAAYGQVIGHGFINYDDNQYVYENAHVVNGLTFQNIIWTFSSMVGANWHPVTMLSHMLDVQIYGLKSGGHHFTNLLFHLLNTLLLYHLFSRLTARNLPSVFTAVLFALHPVHVESVAWVAERKDVLSTFFWLLTMLQYIRFVKSRGLLLYFSAILFFTIGLMAKPMLVTLPFVLLLLDFWPLKRIGLKTQSAKCDTEHPEKSLENIGPNTKQSLNSITLLLFEKMPFFIIVILFCIVVFKVQQVEGAVASVELIPLESRILNALVSYGVYLIKMIWPFELAVFYPFPQIIPLWEPIAAALFITGLSILALIRYRRSPWFLFGWLWYLGTLVPVIGIVQVGAQAMADRYTYIPFIGLFVAVAWEVDSRLRICQIKKPVLLLWSIILFGCLVSLSWIQIRYWRDNITLYEHALKINDDNAVIQNLIGLAKLDQNRTQEAIQHFLKAIWLKPDNGKPYNNLGITLVQKGQIKLAEEAFAHAIELMPDFVDAHINMGIVQSKQGKIEQAMLHFSRALAIAPFHPKAHYNIAVAYEEQNRIEEAVYHYTQAMRHNSKLANAASQSIKRLNMKKELNK